MFEESLSVMSEIQFNRKNSKSYTHAFEELVSEAVDECFSSLGDSCKQAIYFHLKGCYNISKKEIPSRIRDFADALEEIFGPGAKLIEIGIMRALYTKVQDFKYSSKQEELSFTNYVETLQNFL